MKTKQKYCPILWLIIKSHNFLRTLSISDLQANNRFFVVYFQQFDTVIGAHILFYFT